MLECDWGFICERAGPNKAGRFCVESILDIVGSTTFPRQFSPLSAVLRLRGPAGATLPIRVEVAFQSRGDAFQSFDGHVVMAPSGITTLAVNIEGLILPLPGTYEVRFASRGKHLYTVNLEAVQGPRPDQPSSEAEPSTRH